MSNYSIIVHDGEASHCLPITSRDWGIAMGPHFKEGSIFIVSFGVYDNYTVARGMPKGSKVNRRGLVLYRAAHLLQTGIERDADLLSHDYSVGFNNERTRHTGLTSVKLRGRTGSIRARPKGFCYLELFDQTAKRSRVAELIDLRIVETIETDTADIVKLYRRKAETHWLETLPPLLEFLKLRKDKELIIEHVE